MNHIDMMFHFFCKTGYPLGMEKAARGMGLSGKLEGVSGDKAPNLWLRGECSTVLDYVKQDTITTIEIAKAVLRQGSLSWISNSGRPQNVIFPNGWLKVNQAMTIDQPNTSWMSDPMSRTEFYSWVGDYIDQSNQFEKSRNQSIRGTDQKPIETRSEPTEISYDKNAIVSTLFTDDFHNKYPETIFTIGKDIDPKSNQCPDLMDQSAMASNRCKCPLCEGRPNLDSYFKYMFEEPIK